MGQIIGGAAKPKRCNLNQLSQLGTPAAGEYILVSSDNSMNAVGQGNFDCYVEGDGQKAATALELHYINEERKTIEDFFGFPEETINLSSYELLSGVILATGVFQKAGGYGNHKHILIPVAEGDIYDITRNTSVDRFTYAFLTSDVLTGGSAAPFVDGTNLVVDYNSVDTLTIPSGCHYLYLYAANSGGTNYLPSSMIKRAVVGEIENYATHTDVQNAIEQGIAPLVERQDELEDMITEDSSSIVDVPLTIKTSSGTNGYWNKEGVWVAENSRRSTEKIPVSEGETYYVTTNIGTSVQIAYLGIFNGDTWLGVVDAFKGGTGNADGREYVVPSGVTDMVICSTNTTPPTLRKVQIEKVVNFYTREQSDARYAGNSKYGVRWSVSDITDLGERVFDAVGKSAAIGIGSNAGSSDFDNFYPWSGMKRCNITENANGAKIKVYEGESGFALDGSNGDVFVEIPKFKCSAYIKDGYEYRVIGEGNIHPAFIENGKELDAIYVGAFEGYMTGSMLYSRAGVIPSNNEVGSTFLSAAKARGGSYTLADLRSVDAIWTLMAVEYGCRNSNRVIGYGYADYYQAATYQSFLNVSVAQASTNSVTLGKPDSNSQRLTMLDRFAVGNNICICDTNMETIAAQRHVTAVACASTTDNLVVTFDGDPISVTTSMFVGNAPATTNYCETIPVNPLSWHTGRANRGITAGTGLDVETMNPCRYRWIENPVGNVWQMLPDVNFKALQMYYCANMDGYSMGKHVSPYKAVGALMPEQSSNGAKADVNTSLNPNYWITSLLHNVLLFDVKNYGATFDQTHDGTITSKVGFGGYYYLNNYVSNTDEWLVVNGGGFDHLWRCNMLTNRAQLKADGKWYLYGCRLMFKPIVSE